MATQLRSSGVDVESGADGREAVELAHSWRPDLIFMDAPETILPQNAWDDKIVDVGDVVAPYESQHSETAKLCSTFYNGLDFNYERSLIW